MKAVVPVKSKSDRVPNKNFRPFYKEKSLTEITIVKLLKVMPAEDIYLSCEDAQRCEIAEKWKINFVQRDARLAANSTPIVECIRGICSQIPGVDDIMWCQVTDPFFDGYAECVELWRTLPESLYDSLVVVYPCKQYMLDSSHCPIGFGFGVHHSISQHLSTMFRLTFTLSILTRKAVASTGYYVGERPLWFEAKNPTIDIDTEDDWRVASYMYDALVEQTSACGQA